MPPLVVGVVVGVRLRAVGVTAGVAETDAVTPWILLLVPDAVVYCVSAVLSPPSLRVAFVAFVSNRGEDHDACLTRVAISHVAVMAISSARAARPCVDSRICVYSAERVINSSYLATSAACLAGGTSLP